MGVLDKALYRGGSFKTDLGQGFRRTNAEIIKKDLLNHLHTRRGERVMMPDFGSNIHDMLFDPNDEITQHRIMSEVQNVIDYDPRVELIQTRLTADEEKHVISVEILVRFVELEIVDTIKLDLASDV